MFHNVAVLQIRYSFNKIKFENIPEFFMKLIVKNPNEAN
jgi:hypothetical protein